MKEFSTAIESRLSELSCEYFSAAVVMRKRYGEGAYFSKTCKECGHINEGQHTAGVFESESGSLRVYSEEQDFECEKCCSVGWYTISTIISQNSND